MEIPMALASQLVQLQSKATQASQFVAKHGPLYCTTISYWSRISTTFRSHQLLRNYSCYGALQKEIDYVKHILKNRKGLTIENAGVATLFGLECFAWYCAGEIVGQGFTFIGYYV